MIEGRNLAEPVKPPIGCRAKWLVNEERMHELIGAIERRSRWCKGDWCTGTGGDYIRLRDPAYLKEDLNLIMGWTEELIDLAGENLCRLEAKDDSNV